LKLGNVLKKERERRGLTPPEVATALGIAEVEYQQLEGGDSEAERWGPLLAKIAIALETPTSRLLAESGRAADTRPGQAGALIRRHREARDKTPEQLAQELEIALDEYQTIEEGDSPIETYGPRLLAFAETVDQPVFNLFYPAGLPFQELDDYP
jgi:transcriptional regulator with XRE-family HTH domain